MSVHFSSTTDLWETPQEFFARLDAKFHFDPDVTALRENARRARYYSPVKDGLAQEWCEVFWMNPPYGRETDKWVRKALDSKEEGAANVLMSSSRTNQHCIQCSARHSDSNGAADEMPPAAAKGEELPTVGLLAAYG
jgi:phage N-6-adenine-methyltransferase